MSNERNIDVDDGTSLTTSTSTTVVTAPSVAVGRPEIIEDDDSSNNNYNNQATTTGAGGGSGPELIQDDNGPPSISIDASPPSATRNDNNQEKADAATSLQSSLRSAGVEEIRDDSMDAAPTPTITTRPGAVAVAAGSESPSKKEDQKKKNEGKKPASSSALDDAKRKHIHDSAAAGGAAAGAGLSASLTSSMVSVPYTEDTGPPSLFDSEADVSNSNVNNNVVNDGNNANKGIDNDDDDKDDADAQYKRKVAAYNVNSKKPAPVTPSNTLSNNRSNRRGNDVDNTNSNDNDLHRQTINNYDSGTVNTSAVTENTDDAIVQTDMPHAVPVNENDIRRHYNNEREVNENEPVYTAQQVHPRSYPEKRDHEPRPRQPWYKNGVLIGSVATMSIAIVIAALVGYFLSNDKSNENEGSSKSANVNENLVLNSVPTSAPTYPNAPMNCTVASLGPIYEEDCCYCSLALGLDGDTIVMLVSDDWEDSPIGSMQVTIGPFALEQSYIPDHHIEEIAFSSNSFFSSNPIPLSDGEGVVYVNPKDPTGNIMEDTIIIQPDDGDVTGIAQFGTAIYVDEDVLVVGAPNDNDLAGSAFVYRQLDLMTWVKEAKLETGEVGVQNFGNSVLVKGNLVIVASDQYGDNSEGAVFFYRYDNSTESTEMASTNWTLIANYTLMNDDCDGEFGASLAFTSDNGLLISCPLENDAAGALYYYQWNDDANRYMFVQKVMAKNGSSLEKLGANHHHIAVSPSGNFIAVGTYDDDESFDHAIYVFAKFGNVWIEMARITSPDDWSCYFGDNVVITEERIFVSSWENTFEYELECREIIDVEEEEDDTTEEQVFS